MDRKGTPAAHDVSFGHRFANFGTTMVCLVRGRVAAVEIQQDEFRGRWVSNERLRNRVQQELVFRPRRCVVPVDV
jgi:hypothetical protein